jgi:hypothetical protein
MIYSSSVKFPIPFLDCKTFETLLDFFYCGKDVGTSANVEDVLQAASFMQDPCLTNGDIIFADPMFARSLSKSPLWHRY